MIGSVLAFLYWLVNLLFVGVGNRIGVFRVLPDPNPIGYKSSGNIGYLVVPEPDYNYSDRVRVDISYQYYPIGYPTTRFVFNYRIYMGLLLDGWTPYLKVGSPTLEAL